MVLFTSCITPFTFKGIEGDEGCLVIEGDIIVHGDTKVYLSSLRPLGSNYDVSYIIQAAVWVESQQGDRYTGSLSIEANEPPCFLINTRTLSLEQQYKLCVLLLDGTLYESNLLTPLNTPEIDAIGFTIHEVKNAVDFHVTTYGGNNASPYYKWTYIDDWEVVSAYHTNIYFDSRTNVIRQYTDDFPLLYCWNRSKSTAIITRTDHLRENTVFQQKLNTIPYRDDRISYLYSMEVHQMSNSMEAYTYWSVLHRNTDKIGSIFAPQPSELYGNIRCISHPKLKVFGYISAGTRSMKRIFATAQDIGIYYSPYRCYPLNFGQTTPPSFSDLYGWGYRPVGLSPNESIDWLPVECVECTRRGTKNKPPFWPNNHL